MVRILLYVTALVGLFGGAIVYGGNAIGAWDPLPPAPQPPPAVELEHMKAKKKAKPATSASVAPRLTAAQKTWVRKADALCRQSRAEMQSLVSQAYGITSRADLVEFFERVRTVNKQMNDQFLAIHAPASFTRDLGRVQALFQKEERLFDAMYEALERNDMQTYYALSDRVADVSLDESDIAADLGAYDCDIQLLPSFG
jgi:hypothetical protein